MKQAIIDIAMQLIIVQPGRIKQIWNWFIFYRTQSWFSFTFRCTKETLNEQRISFLHHHLSFDPELILIIAYPLIRSLARLLH
jgi:hypothetical protein